MKKRKIVFFAIAICVIAALASSYVWYISGNDFLQNYPTTVGSFNNIGYYKINPGTILASLENDPSDLFQLTSDSSLDKIMERPLSWSQRDYDRIAHKISEYVWAESLDSWELYRMIFITSCHDNPAGFDSADYVYFKKISSNGKSLYTARDIFITPQYGDISLGSDTNFPRTFLGWKNIISSKINVTAEEALLLAENSGGKNARFNMQNRCQIYVSMNLEGYGHSNWKVSYSGNGTNADFELIIPADQ
jgi:hypothetical protein